MEIKSIKFFLLLSLLFSFAILQEEEIQEIELDKDQVYVYGEDSRTFYLKFNSAVSGYAHIQIKPLHDSTLIAYTSRTDKECKKERNSLVMNPNGPLNIFLKENNVPKGGYEYLCVQCNGEPPCDYSININQTEKCKLPLGEQYSYQVNPYTSTMEFEFEYDPSFSFRKLETIENRLNFWVKGQSNPEVTFDFKGVEISESSNFGFGKIIRAEYDTDVKYVIKIKAQEEDYITVGSLYIENDVTRELEVNNLEVMGILTEEDKEICFPFKENQTIYDRDLLRLNGNIFTKKAYTYFKKDGKEITDDATNRTVEDGLIQNLVYPFGMKDKLFCIKHHPKSVVKDLVFSIQLTSPTLFKYNQFIYPPHLPGVIYTHYLVQGETAIIQGMKPKDGAREMNFNMKARKGFPDMYFDRCLNYPNCQYDKNSKYTANPHHSNRMTVYSFYLKDEEEKDYTTISSFQPVMVVNCVEGDQKEIEESRFCQFETSVFSDKDRLYLIEKQTFSQFLLNNEKDFYTITIPPKENIIRVNLDLIIFSGDVDFVVENVKAEKYFLSNKVFYDIPVDNNLAKIDFNVKALKNSFYLVVFQYVYDEYKTGIEHQYYIESGVNYIQSILSEENSQTHKYFRFQNMRFSLATPFLVNFFSQNCNFNIFRTIIENGKEVVDEVPVYDSYSQIVIDIDDPNLFTDKHSFKVDITETDRLKKNCLLYITGLEITNTNVGTEKTISVSDGVTQYFIFSTKYNMIKYSFHASDFNYAVVIDFNLIDRASYIVQISFGNKNYTTVNVYRNDQIFLFPDILKQNCIMYDEVCTINVNIELEKKLDADQCKLETTFHQINGAPIYLEKNAVKQDILFGNEKKYYYFDVDRYEVGDITINHKRGSGYIYAKLVNKTEVENDPEWRGMFTFLQEKGGLKYETYLKKIQVDFENTQYCNPSCYMLLTVENSVHIDNPTGDEKKGFTPFRISITPKLIISDEYLNPNLVPKVKIKVDDFVIGNLFPTTKNIYEFFEVTFPYDSEIVYIDWQADKSSLLANVGNKRPKINETHFLFQRKGYDTLFKMTKEDILAQLDSKHENVVKNTLRDLTLTLGIYNDQADSLYTSVYAFKVFMPQMLKDFKIVYVRSDQKVQCEPFIFNNRPTCAFAVLFDEGDIGNNLVVYPRTVENVDLSFEGSLVRDFEKETTIEGIYGYFENIQKEYYSDNGKKFIYVDNIDRNTSLIFLAYVDQKVNIEVLSSTYKFADNQVFVPNPSSAQIFALGEKSIEFNFETTQDLLVNIVSLSGEGEFYWDTEQENRIKYYLNGYEDRLTLTTHSKNIEGLTRLKVISNTFVGNTPYKAGFVFYMTFYPRNNEYNIDQIRVGRSTEFNYREAKFPLNYFTPISDEEMTISFTFYNYYMASNEKLTYDKELYSIWGKIISEEEAYRSRFDIYYRPVKKGYFVSGSVDGPFATVSLTSEDFNLFNYSQIENPILFLAVDRNEAVEKNLQQLGVEVSLAKENSLKNVDYFVSENIYYNEKLSNKIDNTKAIYKLRTDRSKPYLRLEFASNNGYIKCHLSYDDENKKKVKTSSYIFENGKEIYTAKILNFDDLCIYLTVDSGAPIANDKLTNYVFRYRNAEELEHFVSFKPENNNLFLGEENEDNKYSISFYAIEHYDVSYYIKAVYLNSLIEEEIRDTIAMSESQGYYIQLDNPPIDKNGKIKVDFENIQQDIGYFKVLAKVNNDANKEFLLYNTLIVEDQLEREKINPSDKTIKLNYNSVSKSYKGKASNANKIQKYRLNFDNINEIPKYIQFKLSSTDNINKVMSFTPKDSQGRTGRIQLAQLGNNDEVETWIKKEQLDTNKEYVYMVVECQVAEGETCDYSIDIFGKEAIEFDSPNFVYNFYVNKDNKEMTFKVNNKESYKDQVLTVYATGGKLITIKVDFDYGQSFQGENILIGQGLTTRTKSFNYYTLTITGEEGDYITLGSKLKIDEKWDNNVIQSNGYQLTGFLKSGILDYECYKISDLNIDYNKAAFIVGLFYNKEGKIYYKDKDLNDVNEEQEITTKGYYTYNYNLENNERKYICITFSDEEMDSLPYTLQFIQPGKQYGFSNLFAPQANGNIYPRILEKGSYAFFNGINLNSESEEIIYNMMAKEGLPTMYMYKCDSYPFCEFNENNPGMTKINEINLMSSWHNREKTSPIDAYQYVMFVKCEDLNDEKQADFCQFYTSIYGNLDKIFLMEGKTFSQYILKDQHAHYYIDFSQEIDVKYVYVDILIINGDINIDLVDGSNKNIVFEKYILSNKIFYSVHLNRNTNLERIIVDIEAKMNSYYIIEYKLVRTSDDESSNEINTGINYLIPIPKGINNNEKIIKIHRSKLLDEESYYTSFHSLNCKFDILREEMTGEEEIKQYVKRHSYGYYGEDIFDTKYVKMTEEDDHLSYKIILTDYDKSNYNSDMCMLYVSSVELMKENNYYAQKEILVTEGIPQRIDFINNTYKIKCIYPNINRDKDVTIYFKVINSANFTYTINFNNINNDTDYVAQSKLLYINQNKITEKCEEDSLCYITVSIELTDKKKVYENYPIIEVTIREIGNVPYYLPMGVAKTDFLSGKNYLNLFSTLGKGDQGSITIDFARGSGHIYAKIVPIDGDADEKPEWRQYQLPKSEDEKLKYDFYSKKILFDNKDTEKCDNGCYLLMSIQSSTAGSVDDNFRSFQFSIIVNLIPNNGDLEKNGTIVQIQPEQYIVGSLTDKDKIKNKAMYEFYQLNIPFDAKTVEIDWQSDSATFLLNIGKERPSINNNFKKLESRGDSVFVIKNEDIKKKLGSTPYITNAYLTIGVYSDVLESNNGNSYSFRVHFTKDLNIYRVDSDQKTLCKPQNIGNNEYRCLFMVIYEEFDFIYDTMIYAKSQSLSASISMYGEFIDNTLYDSFNENELSKSIPKEGAKYNTKRDQIDFIFFTLPDIHKHFYVSVISDKPEIIEFISSFKTFDNQLSPNPSSVQLFAVNNDPSINLKFKSTKPLLINIVSLYGSLKLHFENEAKTEYSLRGRDDRISLVIPDDGIEENLVIENTKFNESDRYTPTPENQAEMPGIAFYLEFFLRSDKVNLDEINLGKTTEMVYKKSDFPVDYFSKLDNLDNNINIFFNFHDLEFEPSAEKRMVSPDDITIEANVITQKNIYNIRTGTQSRPKDNEFKGRFDPALQAGYLYLPSEKLQNLKTSNPTLYLSINKKNENTKFKKIRLELTAAEKNSEIPVTEKIYQYGNIKGNEIISYKLKVDNSTGDMRIQFGRNSKYVNFAISDSPNKKENMTLKELDTKEDTGKSFITFNKPQKDYIYLNVYADNDNGDSRLNNYVFKYMNSNNRNNFFEYKFLSGYSKIKANYKDSNLKVKFNKIDKANVEITYSLKVCKKWEKSDEEFDQTIAFTEYSPTVMQAYNPSGEGINMQMENVELKDFSYLIVIAQIKDGPIIEYVAYDPKYEFDKDKIDDNTKPVDNDDDDDDDDDVLIAIVASIGGAIFIILVALVVIILIYNRKTKDLLQQVNKISFADGDTKDKNENLLLDDNELK